MKLLKEFVAFIREREAIHQRRLKGQEPPWTRDPILARYRFCNVRREDDRVTRWIHANWLRPHTSETASVIFAMAVARLVNWPPTLEAIGWPVPFLVKRFTSTIDNLRSEGKAYSSAYIIHADAHHRTKAAYLAECVLTPIWDARRELALILSACSLQAFHRELMTFRALGSFMAAQIVADVKWGREGQRAKDWATFAAPGPGSLRGMSWVEFGDPGTKYSEPAWQDSLRLIVKKLPPELRDLDAQNVQNCLCEFSKYMKAKNGLGRPRQNFMPSKELYGA